MKVGNSADLAPQSGTSPAEGEKEEKRPSSLEAPEQRNLFIRAQRRKLRRFGNQLYCSPPI
jgi:hypothetical protein